MINFQTYDPSKPLKDQEIQVPEAPFVRPTSVYPYDIFRGLSAHEAKKVEKRAKPSVTDRAEHIDIFAVDDWSWDTSAELALITRPAWRMHEEPQQ